MSPDLAALEAEMRKEFNRIIARGNRCEYCDGYGRTSKGTRCEWCDGDQFAEVDEAANLIAVLDGKDAEIARLRGELREMAAALEPFAEEGERWGHEFDDDECMDNSFCLSTCRRAARVLSAYRASEAERDGGSDA